MRPVFGLPLRSEPPKAILELIEKPGRASWVGRWWSDVNYFFEKGAWSKSKCTIFFRIYVQR